jgi:threonine synthase
MDVGDPSNFSRIIELYGSDIDLIKSKVCSYSISDIETRKTIEDVYKTHNYILDPHAAVAYSSMKNWHKNNRNKKGIILGTAHPLKFPMVVKELTKKEIEVPENIKSLMQKEKKSILMTDNYADIKNTITNISESTLA